MTLAWELRLAATPKLVLLALCDWANEEGVCFPSINRIAARASLSPRQCKRVLSQLASGRWFRVIGNLAGGASSRRYQINIEALRGGVAHVTGDILSPVPPMTPLGGRQCHSGSDTDVTRTTNEPSAEPPLPLPCPKLPLAAPRQLSEQERVVVVGLLDGFEDETAQSLLDELAGQMAADKIRTTPANFMRALVKRARDGQFMPSYGPTIAAKREREAAERNARSQQKLKKVAEPATAQAHLREISALLGTGGGRPC